jgi:hypothetical protein
MLLRPKPIKRTLVILIKGEEAFDGFCRFLLDHSGKVKVTEVRGSSVFEEVQARTYHWITLQNKDKAKT